MTGRERKTQQKAYTHLIANNRKKLSVIILVGDRIDTIDGLLKSVSRLQPKEIIVIEDGNKSRTATICLAHSAMCISYPFSLGKHVGRSIGAAEATGDVLLFLDGDVALKKKDLLPFIAACYEGVDIALHNDNPSFAPQMARNQEDVLKVFFNHVMRMPQLGVSCLESSPHAMTKQAAKRIGIENLSIPPKAQSIAILKGLRVRHVHHIAAVAEKKSRLEKGDVLCQQQMLGDHIEAIYWAQMEKGNRIFF